jgi:hypothetical protein
MDAASSFVMNRRWKFLLRDDAGPIPRAIASVVYVEPRQLPLAVLLSFLLIMRNLDRTMGARGHGG